MSTIPGYAGNILYVDLSKHSIHVEKLDPRIAMEYLGGSGLAAKIIRDRMNLRSDPFSEGNLLVIATGPLNNPLIPCGARASIATRSPLTNAWGEAHVGTRFAILLKKAGYDAVVIAGKAEEPVWLSIEDENVEIRSAKDIWGRSTSEVFKYVASVMGRDASTLAIGRAGENLVRYSAIISDEGGAAARSGVGAVMGFKRLKSIAVRGSSEVPVAFKTELTTYSRNLAVRMAKSAGGQRLRKFGTAVAVTRYYQLGNLPVRNFSRGLWRDESIKKISGEYLAERYLHRITPCWGCPVGCKRTSLISIDSSAIEVRTPDYETVGMLGSNLLIDDTEAIIFASHLCNEYGIDTISLGGVLGFAFEAYERGLITDQDTCGVKLVFGNSSALIESIRRIAERDGELWYLLGEGVKRACESLNRDSCRYAVHVKGLEVPAHDGRAFFVQGLSYATMNRGACHLAWPHRVAQGSVYPELGIKEPVDRFQVDRSWHVVKVMQDYMEIFDSLVMCKYAISAGTEVRDVIELLRLTTGWDVSPAELLKIGERIFNLKRVLNIEWGMSSKDDNLPLRMLEPLQDGGSAGKAPDLKIMLEKYYEIRGWDSEGRPTKEKLEELGLVWG